MKQIKVIVKRIVGVLNIPARIPQFIAKAKNIVLMMTNNPNFPTPYPSNTPTLTAVTADITALETAESTALTKTKGAAEARDVKKSLVMKDLYALLRYIQGVADNSPPNAEAIILSSGFDVKKAGERIKAPFEALNGEVSGTVILRAKSAGIRSSYEWQMSMLPASLKTDSPATQWTDLPSTLQAKTEVSGLTPGSTMQFRYRAVTKSGEGSWSQVVSIIVL